jgi:LmbE family N-acetylglucosaminyl deacetylase
MQRLLLNRSLNSPLRILCLGAHSDDIEIGCGGALLRLLRENRQVAVTWVIFSADAIRRRETESSAALFLAGARHVAVICHEHRDSFFPDFGQEIKEHFLSLQTTCKPDLILTHYRDDLHQDHRVVADLTWNVFRNHLILEYEIPKYDGDLGRPNFFVPLDPALCRRKTQLILRSFRSQKGRDWFTRDLFLALLRLRGMECRSPSGYAEAFYCRKIVI